MLRPILVFELMLAFWVFDSGFGDLGTADVELSDLVVEELERLEGADKATAEPSGDDVEKSDDADGDDVEMYDEADGNDMIIEVNSSGDSGGLIGTSVFGIL
ncbi:MAG: hypothetical protein Q9178_003405 [Gyalolechia marmorata]